jgi:hypothetical protein
VHLILVDRSDALGAIGPASRSAQVLRLSGPMELTPVVARSHTSLCTDATILAAHPADVM